MVCGFFGDGEVFVEKVCPCFDFRGPGVSGGEDTVVCIFEVGRVCRDGGVEPVDEVEFLCMQEGWVDIVEDEFVGKSF